MGPREVRVCEFETIVYLHLLSDFLVTALLSTCQPARACEGSGTWLAQREAKDKQAHQRSPTSEPAISAVRGKERAGLR